MPLSPRAERYVHRRSRVQSINEPKEIEHLLRRSRYPVYEPVVTFQSNYGGLTLDTGLEPLQYGIVHLNSRTRWEPGTISGGLSQQGVWYFECCNTLCQCAFEIDQAGNYFEDGDPIAATFDVFIEGAAVYDELWSLGWRTVNVPLLEQPHWIQRPELLHQMIERFGLSTITEATDAFSGWWMSDAMALWKRGSRCTVLEKSKTLRHG